jgi:hypothetical protein
MRRRRGAARDGSVEARAPDIDDFSLAQHDHSNAANGGAISASALPSSGVTVGSYGSATQVGTFTVDAHGLLTAAANVAIAIPSSQITNATTTSTASSVPVSDGSGHLDGAWLYKKLVPTDLSGVTATTGTGTTLALFGGLFPPTLPGAVTFSGEPQIADLTGMNHDHQSLAGGGPLDGAAIQSGAVALTVGGTGQRSAYAAFDALTVQGADIASASTTHLDTATGVYVNITGTTTITAFGTASAGVVRVLKFVAALTLTYNATSLILPGAVNITTAAGDTAIFVSMGSGNWRCIDYVRAASPPPSGTNTGDQTITLTGAVTGSGTGSITASLGSFTSAQLATALSDETGTGAAVFANSPILVTPALGTPSALVLTNATGLPIGGGGTGATTAEAARQALEATTFSIASASTTDLSTATGQSVTITSNTNISSFGTVTAGATFFCHFNHLGGNLINSSNLLLPGGANISWQIGDAFTAISRGSGVWEVRNYQVAGTTPPSGTNTGDQTITLTGDVTGTGTGSFATTVVSASTSTAGKVQLATDGDTSASHAVVGTDNRLMKGIDAEERIFRSTLPDAGTGFAFGDQTAYFVYVGRTAVTCTPKFVKGIVRSAGTGAQTAEIGIFSSPNAPNKTNQTLTKLEATGTVDSLIGTGLVGNTSAFSTSVAAGTYLWAGIRTHLASTQPSFMGLLFDNGYGLCLSLASSGALTASSSFSGSLIAASSTAMCPDLFVTLD